MSTQPRLPSAIADKPANFRTIFAHQPALAARFSAMYAHFWSDGVVDHPTKEATRLRNARITDCGY